jgi:hypothetical protein
MFVIGNQVLTVLQRLKQRPDLVANEVAYGPELIRRHSLRHRNVPAFLVLGLETGATVVAQHEGYVELNVGEIRESLWGVLPSAYLPAPPCSNRMSLSPPARLPCSLTTWLVGGKEARPPTNPDLRPASGFGEEEGAQ